MFIRTACIAVALSVCAVPAKATLFDLIYDTNGAAPGGVLEAVIDGTLQADGNTVVVTSVLDFATFDGVNLPSLPVVSSFDEVLTFGTGLDPVLTLDGSFLDFAAATDNTFQDGFAFFAGSQTATFFFGDGFTAAGPVIGEFNDPFVLANYSLTAQPASAVPVPASLGFLLAGAGMLVARGRIRR